MTARKDVARGRSGSRQDVHGVATDAAVDGVNLQQRLAGDVPVSSVSRHQSPEPYYSDDTVTIYGGDCLDVLPTLPDASIDAICTDPPYGIGFMGKEWDSGKAFVERKPARRNAWDHVGGNHNPVDAADAARTRRVEAKRFGKWCEGWAAECLRVLKPGGYLLAFGGTRTWHRLVCALEDVGFEIRECAADLTGRDAPGLVWAYGQGFPKSHNLDGEWKGWGTALKPAWEPIAVARKPLAGTVAANVLEHGTGALNIDACRIPAGRDYRDKCASVVGLGSNRNGDAYGEWTGVREDSAHDLGRWPTNLLLTHSASCNEGPCVPDCPVAELDKQSGARPSGGSPGGESANTGMRGNTFMRIRPERQADAGGASRYFPIFRYEAKAPASERPRGEDGTAHVTVKPLALMRWLVRLVTPPGGVCLDPFLGSGTTAEACLIEGFRCIGIERDPAHLPLIKARLSKPIQPTLGFGEAS